ncbi:hypothetical protein [Aureispira sp. CCB-QB1]|uniref:hypothetical protein n=1 Tax=Aureispira sp. CCB-QB1 TaxID=1313421 RepID=UPI0006972F64|nr:hypothetical protein [Aureispira sp. CCB-QB1]
MKPIYIILLVVLLLGGGGLTAFYIHRKKKNSTPQSPKLPIHSIQEIAKKAAQEKEKKPIVNQPKVKESIELDIKVSHVDIAGRQFDYSMHYKGIPYKGRFKDGVTNGVHIKKSFGAFVVKQRMNQERGSYDSPTKLTAKQQKMRGVTTKGGAVKVGATGKGNVTGISGVTPLQSDWVDLFILDQNERVLKQLSVNLTTGTTTLNAQFPKK